MAIALHHSQAKGATKLVLLGIANHDGDGGSWPSISTLARYANVDERTAQRAIGKLQALGEIHRDIQGGGTWSTPSHRRPNRYVFTLDCPASCDRSSRHRSWGDVRVTPPGDAGVTLTVIENHQRTVSGAERPRGRWFSSDDLPTQWRNEWERTL